MIEELAERIPAELLPRSGKVFYSGRLAFSAPSALYVLGINPGGDPSQHESETVGSHTAAILRSYPDDWSAYRDELWNHAAPEPMGWHLVFSISSRHSASVLGRFLAATWFSSALAAKPTLEMKWPCFPIDAGHFMNLQSNAYAQKQFFASARPQATMYETKLALTGCTRSLSKQTTAGGEAKHLLDVTS